MTEDQRSNPEPRKLQIPTPAEAKQDRKTYEALVTGAGNDPQIEELRRKAELWTNYIFKDAGTIPDGDPRHEVFEHYNSILAHR